MWHYSSPGLLMAQVAVSRAWFSYMLHEQVNRKSADPSMSSAAAKEDDAAARMDDLEAQVS